MYFVGRWQWVKNFPNHHGRSTWLFKYPKPPKAILSPSKLPDVDPNTTVLGVFSHHFCAARGTTPHVARTTEPCHGFQEAQARPAGLDQCAQRRATVTWCFYPAACDCMRGISRFVGEIPAENKERRYFEGSESTQI